MAAFSIGKLFGVSIIIVIVLYFTYPMIQEVTGYNSAQSNQTAGIIQQITGEPVNSISNTLGQGSLQNTFSLINNSATKGNSTSGGALFANVANNIGLGFIYSAIGNFVIIIESFSQTMAGMLSALSGVLPAEFSIIPFNLVASLLGLYISTRVLVQVISSWQKFALWDS